MIRAIQPDCIVTDKRLKYYRNTLRSRKTFWFLRKYLPKYTKVHLSTACTLDFIGWCPSPSSCRMLTDKLNALDSCQFGLDASSVAVSKTLA